MKKMLFLSLSLMSLNTFAALECKNEDGHIEITVYEKNVKLQSGEETKYLSVSQIITDFSVLSKRATYSFLNAPDSKLVLSKKVLNTRVPNCGRRTDCGELPWAFSTQSALLTHEGLETLLTCNENTSL